MTETGEDATEMQKLKRYNCFYKIAIISSVSFLSFSVCFYFGGQLILQDQIREV
jgi:hypothetical protein